MVTLLCKLVSVLLFVSIYLFSCLFVSWFSDRNGEYRCINYVAMKQICHTYSHSVGLVIVEFIDCCESGGDNNDDDGDVDATFCADDGALQWETN